MQPGLVVSIQTFGSYAANFHPHLHALITDGAFTSDGEFVELPYFDGRLVEEVFRRRLLGRLHRAERLSEEFHRSLLGWVHSGFSAHGEQRVPAEDVQDVERLARYITRAPIALDRLQPAEEGCVRVTTPPDPRTGATVLRLDALDWIHAVAAQIPDRGGHLVRYYGSYSSRSRGARRRARGAEGSGRIADEPGPAAEGPSCAPPPGGLQPNPGPAGSPQATPSRAGPQKRHPPQPPRRPSRASWARLLRRIMEVDPLLCARCGSEMKVVSVINDPAVIDAILRHVGRTGGQDPFEGRPPPAA